MLIMQAYKELDKFECLYILTKTSLKEEQSVS